MSEGGGGACGPEVACLLPVHLSWACALITRWLKMSGLGAVNLQRTDGKHKLCNSHVESRGDATRLQKNRDKQEKNTSQGWENIQNTYYGGAKQTLLSKLKLLKVNVNQMRWKQISVIPEKKNFKHAFTKNKTDQIRNVLLLCSKKLLESTKLSLGQTSSN